VQYPVSKLIHFAAFAAVLLSNAGVQAQSSNGSSAAFGVGESLVYDVKYGFLNVGTGKMEVVGIDTIRGREAWHFRLAIRAGIPGFRVHDVLESWVDVESFKALRYRQTLTQGGKQEKDSIEIYPERGVYQEVEWRQARDGSGWTQKAKPEAPTVSEPLDEASFLFFARTQPLEEGNTYTFARYYKPDKNPVQVTVVRREKVNVPAGTFSTIVLRPVFKTKGIFSQNGRAEMWVTDDDRRMMVRMETHVAFGSITLLLKEFQSGLIEP
jgi:hypothetical protein